MSDAKNGWAWFDVAAADGMSGFDPELDEPKLVQSAARCFRGADGERLLAHLRALTVERALGPAADDAVLRHTEGQRQLVSYISHLIERGRNHHG